MRRNIILTRDFPVGIPSGWQSRGLAIYRDNEKNRFSRPEGIHTGKECLRQTVSIIMECCESFYFISILQKTMDTTVYVQYYYLLLFFSQLEIIRMSIKS